MATSGWVLEGQVTHQACANYMPRCGDGVFCDILSACLGPMVVSISSVVFINVHGGSRVDNREICASCLPGRIFSLSDI